MQKLSAEYIRTNKKLFINKHAVIIVGAGLSVPSNIPDFRSPDGLFAKLRKKYKIRGEDIFSYRFTIDQETRGTYLKVISELKELINAAAPSKGHNFLKNMQNCQRNVRVYTQNVDGLEEMAGLVCTKNDNTDLIYLHGNLNNLVCTYCGYKKVFGENECAIFKKGKEIECERCLTKNYGQTYFSSGTDKDLAKKTEKHGGTSEHIKCNGNDKHENKHADNDTSKDNNCEKENRNNDKTNRVGNTCRSRRKKMTGFMNTNIIHYYQVHPDSHFIAKMINKDKNCQLLIVMGTSLRVHGIKQLVGHFSRVTHMNNGKSVFVNLEKVSKNMMECFDYFYEGRIEDFCDIFEKCIGTEEDKVPSFNNAVHTRNDISSMAKRKSDTSCIENTVCDEKMKNKKEPLVKMEKNVITVTDKCELPADRCIDEKCDNDVISDNKNNINDHESKIITNEKTEVDDNQKEMCNTASKKNKTTRKKGSKVNKKTSGKITAENMINTTDNAVDKSNKRHIKRLSFIKLPKKGKNIQNEDVIADNSKLENVFDDHVVKETCIKENISHRKKDKDKDKAENYEFVNSSLVIKIKGSRKAKK